MVSHGTISEGDAMEHTLTAGIKLYAKYYILAYDASEDPKTLNLFSATDTQIAGIALMSTKVFDDKYGDVSATASSLGNNIMATRKKGRFSLLTKVANSAIKKGDKVYVVTDTITIEGASRATTPCVDLAPAYTALSDAVTDANMATWYTERQLEIGIAAEAMASSSADGSRLLVDVDIPTVIVHPVETA